MQAPGQTTDNEKELLLRIAEGDELAFGKIFKSYYPTLLNFVSRIDQNNENADDFMSSGFSSDSELVIELEAMIDLDR